MKHKKKGVNNSEEIIKEKNVEQEQPTIGSESVNDNENEKLKGAQLTCYSRSYMKYNIETNYVVKKIKLIKLACRNPSYCYLYGNHMG